MKDHSLKSTKYNNFSPSNVPLDEERMMPVVTTLTTKNFTHFIPKNEEQANTQFDDSLFFAGKYKLIQKLLTYQDSNNQTMLNYALSINNLPAVEIILKHLRLQPKIVNKVLDIPNTNNQTSRDLLKNTELKDKFQDLISIPLEKPKFTELSYVQNKLAAKILKDSKILIPYKIAELAKNIEHKISADSPPIPYIVFDGFKVLSLIGNLIYRSRHNEREVPYFSGALTAALGTEPAQRKIVDLTNQWCGLETTKTFIPAIIGLIQFFYFLPPHQQGILHGASKWLLVISTMANMYKSYQSFNNNDSPPSDLLTNFLTSDLVLKILTNFLTSDLMLKIVPHVFTLFTSPVNYFLTPLTVLDMLFNIWKYTDEFSEKHKHYYELKGINYPYLSNLGINITEYAEKIKSTKENKQNNIDLLFDIFSNNFRTKVIEIHRKGKKINENLIKQAAGIKHDFMKLSTSPHAQDHNYFKLFFKHLILGSDFQNDYNYIDSEEKFYDYFIKDESSRMHKIKALIEITNKVNYINACPQTCEIRQDEFAINQHIAADPFTIACESKGENIGKKYILRTSQLQLSIVWKV